jgi:hypothetical protein
MGFVLNVDGGRMQDLDYIRVRITEQRDNSRLRHTRWMNALSKRRGWYCDVGTSQVVQSNE